MTFATQITSDLSTACGPATITPIGELRVATPASQLFQDTFDTGTLDTVNRWVTPTAGGTGIAATNAVGATVLDGGTTANSFSKLSSQVSFPPSEPGFLLFHERINIEFPVVTTAHRFFGFGTSGASPTIAAPITQGLGFEIATDGKLYAVAYQTGSRVVIADLSRTTGNKTQPVDGNAHKYIMFFRGDQGFFCIDDEDAIVASFPTGASGPDINTLPLLNQVISNSGTHATIQLNAATVGDTSHTGSTQLLWNGFTFDKQKPNTDTNATLITAVGATTSQTGADQLNINGKGVKVVLDMTVNAGGAGSVTLTIQGKDVVSGKYYTLLVGAAVVTVSTNVYELYPGLPATANVSANTLLPRTWRVITTANNANATSYTVGASVIV
ncbi:MAG TPA: hypothetical protein VK626_01610 [Nitrospiraceae bacterium]|nr:hypothetical protein [Nitrospiraceae bacterium]